MKDEGWLKLYRKIWRNSWARNPNYLAVWVWILTHAEYREKGKADPVTWNGVTRKLEKGELTFGADKIAKETKVHVKSVERAIKKFKDEKQIETQTNNHFTLCRVINWKKYQKNPKKTEERIEEQSEEPEEEQQSLIPELIQGKKAGRQKSKRGTERGTTEERIEDNIEEIIPRREEGEELNTIAPLHVAEVKGEESQKPPKATKPAKEDPLIAQGIVKVIEVFQKSCNPTINYANKTERDAASDLIKAYGLETVIEQAEFAVKHNKRPYAPGVFKPSDLSRKWPNIEKFKVDNGYTKEPNKTPLPDEIDRQKAIEHVRTPEEQAAMEAKLNAMKANLKDKFSMVK